MPPGWEELFAGAHGGRPYYHDRETGVTQWAEPSQHRLDQEAVDAAVFGLEQEAVRRVMAPLRTMQGHAAHWPATRDLLLRIVVGALHKLNPGLTHSARKRLGVSTLEPFK
jgi:hypothetical protein